MKRRQKHTGAGISEYMIIFALVVVVAIPAVMTMGSMLSQSYGTNDPTTKADALYGLLDGKGGVGSGGPGAQGGDLQNQPVPGVIEVSAGAGLEDGAGPVGTVDTNAGVTGTVESAGSDTVTELSTMSTTSAQGNLAEALTAGAPSAIQGSSQKLEEIANAMEAAGDTEMAGRIRDLADLGYLNSDGAQAIEDAFLSGAKPRELRVKAREVGFAGYSTVKTANTGNDPSANMDLAAKSDWKDNDLTHRYKGEYGPRGATKDLLEYYQTNIMGQVEDGKTASEVHTLVNEIAHAAGSINDLGSQYGGTMPASDDDRAGQYKAFLKAESRAFSKAAKSASDGLCKAGKGKGSGGSCS